MNEDEAKAGLVNEVNNYISRLDVWFSFIELDEGKLPSHIDADMYQANMELRALLSEVKDRLNHG